MKIDAESAEIDILQGMAKTLADVRPLVSTGGGDFSIEGTGSSNEIVKQLTDAGYRAVEFDGQKVVPHQPRQRYGEDNLLLAPNVTVLLYHQNHGLLRRLRAGCTRSTWHGGSATRWKTSWLRSAGAASIRAQRESVADDSTGSGTSSSPLAAVSEGDEL